MLVERAAPGLFTQIILALWATPSEPWRPFETTTFEKWFLKLSEEEYEAYLKDQQDAEQAKEDKREAELLESKAQLDEAVLNAAVLK